MNLPLANPFFTIINCHSIYFTSFHNVWLQKAGHRPVLFFGTFCKLRVTAEHVPRALHMREYTCWLYPLCWANALSEELYAILTKKITFPNLV